MRNILTLIAVLLGVVASGQVKQTYNQYGGLWNRLALKDSGAFQLPRKTMGIKDTNLGLDTAQIYYDKTDSTVKVWTGFQWLGAGGAGIVTGTGTLNQVTYWTGTSAIGGVGPGTNNQVLVGNTGSPPTFRAIQAGDLPATSPYTWQQVLTAGSTLTGNNTITGGGFSFTYNNLGQLVLNGASGGSSLGYFTNTSGANALTVAGTSTSSANDVFQVLGGAGAATILFNVRASGTMYAPLLTNLTTQDRLLGQINSSGQMGNVTIGSNLTLASGVLSASAGTPSLTATQVGYGSGVNLLTSDANFTRDANAIYVNSATTQQPRNFVATNTVNAVNGGSILLGHARTGASTRILADDALGSIAWRGDIGGGFPGGSEHQAVSSVRASGNYTATNYGNYMTFELTPDSSTAIGEKMRLSGNGRLGIMNNNPAYTLDVTGQTNISDGARVQGYTAFTAGAGIEFGYYAPGPYGYIQAYDRTGAVNKDLAFGVQTPPQLYLKASDSRIGIGIAAPTSLLHIDGFNTTNSIFRVASFEHSVYSLNNGWIGENTYFNGSNLVYRATGAASVLYFSGNEMQFRSAVSGTAGTNTGLTSGAQLKSNADGTVAIGGTAISVTAGTYTGATMVVNASKVGIGQNVFIGDITTTPTAYLHRKAGTATASTAPDKWTAGTLLTVIEPLTREANASSLYGSNVALNRYAEGGAIKDFIATVDNVGTGETDLFTYTTKASTLAADGEKLNFNIGGTFNDLTATAQLQFYFGGTNIGNTGALTVSATGGWSANVLVIRTSSTTVRTLVTLTTPGASIAVYTSQIDVTGLTLSNTNIIKITGTAGGASGGNGDISAKLGVITWNGAANN